MKIYLCAALVSIGSAACVATNEPLTAFTPSVTKDGTQSFRFATKAKLPSYLEGQDPRQIHETLISNELGKRQFCMRGYEIVSVTTVLGDTLIYQGVCKP